MTEYCKGCGVQLQNEDPDALGYVPKLDASYCQRCFRIRNYGDVTIDMKQGIESSKTLDKINEVDGTVFWVVDLFAFESNMISRLNKKLPGKDIVLVLTKRDILPDSLSDDKIYEFVDRRLKDEGIEVRDMLIVGGLLKHGEMAQESIENLKAAMDYYRKGGNVIFMGTANAGKSTLINQLLHSGDLTVSRNPGTTLDLIPIEQDGWTIYDTPGIENHHSLLSVLPAKELKTVIPTKPIRPFVSQIYEDQSFAAGGLARLDIQTDGKATVVGNFSRNLPIRRGKLAKADELWTRHLNGMLSPAADTSLLTMHTWHAPKLQPGEKMDVDIAGIGWFTVSGDVRDIYVKVHKGVDVTFRKAMI